MKVEELVKRLRGIDHMSVEDCFLQSPLFGHAADKLEELAAENERLLNLCDRLRQEAQMHSMEARGANATIAKIYQAVTGRSGEPGNWNGAEPVIAALAEKDQEIAALRRLISSTHKRAVNHTDCENTSCPICVGGLFVCADCGAVEIETEQRICSHIGGNDVG